MTLAPVEPERRDPAPAELPFWRGLQRYAGRPALVTETGPVTYEDLSARVEALRGRLGPVRRLVLLHGANDVDTVVGYLAALAGGHPVLLVPAGDRTAALDTILAAYDPDVVLDGADLRERRPGTRHALHPDLALLLSTSGSTGSPKLVRLSHANLAANAEAIATYLGIRPTDVGATTLPIHYCYGLSVVNSHLSRGAAVLLTGRSVVEPCFWREAQRHGVTSLAGVPHTFDLLDRISFPDLAPASLRYVTQAGGRLAPDRVRAYAELGRERGWDLFVMYGQTEATARMAYLPPDLAHEAPEAIGRPVPGGSFHLVPVPERPLDTSDPAEDGEPTVGELVFRGDNVMLGYAIGPADLARGREVHELHTGDVARRRPDGLLEIVGRRSRFAKVLGLRVDLDRVEQLFDERGHRVHVADLGSGLLLAVDQSARAADPSALLAIARDAIGLPPTTLRVLPLTDVPRLPSGKTDYRSLVALAETGPAPAENQGCSSHDRAAALRATLGEVLGCEVADTDTFVGLGGDSLSYVETSVRLEALLGRLPAGWPTATVAELAGGAPSAPTRGRSVETGVLLRALAIVMVVGTHANLFVAAGGAHVLLAVAGFNVGRFHLTDAPRARRVRHLLTSAARIAVPSALWLTGVALLTDDLGWRNVLLLNSVLGPASWAEPAWWYWFVEVAVWTLVALAAMTATPWFDRTERRWPFWLPFAIALLALLTRYDVISLAPGDDVHRGTVVLWLFALGWATVKATRTLHLILVSAVAVATVPGFFDDPAREAVVVTGLLALVWLPSVRLPRLAARAVSLLASASFAIYLTHWQVYPHLEDDLPWLATLLSLLVGLTLWALSTKVPQVPQVPLPRPYRP